METAPLTRKPNQQTKHTTTKSSQNQKTRNSLKPPFPTPKNNFHDVPLADTSVTLAFLCLPSSPECLRSQGLRPGRLEAVGSTSPPLTTQRTPRSGLRPPPYFPLEHCPLSVWVRVWKCKARGGKVVTKQTWNLGSWLCHFLENFVILSLKHWPSNATNLKEFFYN